MLLADKSAVVYGGGRAFGGAIARAFARAFAREGARVFLAGRTQQKLEAVARDIVSAGGSADTARVDALDEHAVMRHADAVAAEAGSVDVAVNAIGILHVQGVPFPELSLDDYAHPIIAYTRTNFVTAKAVARHMIEQGSGVILTLSTPGSRLPGPGFIGYGVACAAIEAISRHLAGELGPSGVRVICLMSDAIPEAAAAGSHSRDVFQPVAERAGLTVQDLLVQATDRTLLKRFPTLADVANTAAFLASDHASAITGTVANLTCGTIVD